jgi:hypothetical protein
MGIKHKIKVPISVPTRKSNTSYPLLFLERMPKKNALILLIILMPVYKFAHTNFILSAEIKDALRYFVEIHILLIKIPKLVYYLKI